MQAFKDCEGRTWEVSVNVTTKKRVRKLLGIDLPALLQNKLKPLGELLGDDERLVDLLYALCADRADELGVSDEDFGRAMYGDPIFAGRNAFLEAFADFFPEPRMRQALKKMIQTVRRAEDLMLAKCQRETDKIDVEQSAQQVFVTMEKTLADRSTSSSTAAPASSGSTPDRSLCASSAG